MDTSFVARSVDRVDLAAVTSANILSFSTVSPSAANRTDPGVTE
ncbi:hypothetical protein CY0110_19442 [Crocosphaera chwakensis CCY0110]|uniref:Uncharacterized protein n=1 Tax=Crocosphaera chwakensis CCY0110 TaxID=391612 RepID=A3IJM0_9CHRO|nr:hypothetical protein CY0110_19442 [Crocosphaera chwakensis CCY0110]